MPPAADAIDAALDGVTDAELDRRPPSGWTAAREIAHHVADSETMAYIRLRRLSPRTSRSSHGYDEPEWARRLHYDRPIAASVAVVARGPSGQPGRSCRSLTPDEWARTGTHTSRAVFRRRAGWPSTPSTATSTPTRSAAPAAARTEDAFTRP